MAKFNEEKTLAAILFLPIKTARLIFTPSLKPYITRTKAICMNGVGLSQGMAMPKWIVDQFLHALMIC